MNILGCVVCGTWQLLCAPLPFLAPVPSSLVLSVLFSLFGPVLPPLLSSPLCSCTTPSAPSAPVAETLIAPLRHSRAVPSLGFLDP